MGRHYKVAPEQLSEEAREIITGRKRMPNIELKLGGDWKGREDEWADISSEEWRTYVFESSSDKLDTIVIDYPQYLNVSVSGGHRIVDTDGLSHYIPSGWIHLFWKADPHFVK